MNHKLRFLGSDVSIRNINYQNNRTNFYLDIKFRKEGKTYHIAQQTIELDGWYESGHKGNNRFPVYYNRVNFEVDSIDLSLKEITDTLVSFLAHYKLYLHHFSITKQESYVSYIRPVAESDKSFGLIYEPTYRQSSIYIDVEAQLEDNVDYYNLLDIKTKEPIESISEKELNELGYKFHDYYIDSFAILDDKYANKIR